VSNLLGHNSENPNLLKGQYFDYNCCYDGTVETAEVAKTLVKCSMVAYLFDDYSSSLNFLQDSFEKKYIYSSYQYPIMLFFEGLASLAKAKCETNKKPLIEVAERNIAELRNFCQNVPQNYLNKLRLLEAELAVVQNDLSKAILRFKEAIALSRKNNFIQEEGLANERQGLFLLDMDSLDESHLSLRNAHACYEKWGATGMVQKLEKNYPSVFKGRKNHEFNVNESIDLQLNDPSECVSVLTDMSFISNNSKKKVTFQI